MAKRTSSAPRPAPKVGVLLLYKPLRPLLAESGPSGNLRKGNVLCAGATDLLVSHQVVAPTH